WQPRRHRRPAGPDVRVKSRIQVSDGPDEGLERAAAQARRLIHDNDVEQLKRLLAQYPALLSWRGDDEGGLLGIATGRSSTAISTWPTFCSPTAPISTQRGARTNRRASCTSSSFTRTTSRCSS